MNDHLQGNQHFTQTDGGGRLDLRRRPDAWTRTAVGAFLVSGLVVAALAVGTSAAMHDTTVAPAPQAPVASTSPDDGLWGGPDAVGRRIHDAGEGALWGGPDAVGRRIHASHG